MTTVPKNNKKAFERRGKIFAYCMISFAVVHFAIFWIYVNFDQFRMAFMYRTFDGKEFTTWDNFKNIINDFGLTDSTMLYLLKNTIKYWIMGAVKLVVTVFIAYFLWKKIPGHNFFLFLFFLPNIIPPVMYVTLFKNIISTVGPIANILQKLFGYEMPPLLQHFSTATNTIVFYTFWAGFGVGLLIFVGAFSRIPDGIIDAAKIDGCGWLRELISINLPLIWETAGVMLILNVSTLFTASGPILLFTNGNTYTKTYTISFWIYMEVQKGNFYYPSAVGIFFTVLALPLVVISRVITSSLNKGVTF